MIHKIGNRRLIKVNRKISLDPGRGEAEGRVLADFAAAMQITEERPETCNLARNTATRETLIDEAAQKRTQVFEGDSVKAGSPGLIAAEEPDQLTQVVRVCFHGMRRSISLAAQVLKE